MDIPAAATSAVNTMRASDYFIVLVAVSVKLFPLAGFRGD
jgi:hypothetical protein